MKINCENLLVGGFTPWTVSRLLHASAFVGSSVSLSVSCFRCKIRELWTSARTWKLLIRWSIVLVLSFHGT